MPYQPPSPQWIKVSEARRLLGKLNPDGSVTPVSRAWVGQLVKAGLIRGRLINARKLLVYLPNVLAYRAANTAGEPIPEPAPVKEEHDA